MAAVPRPAVPLVPFPPGLPVANGHFGLFRASPGTLPVTLVFRDWDLLWLVGGRLGLRYIGLATLSAGPGDLVVIPPFQPVEVSEQAAGLAYWYCHASFLLPGDRMQALPAADQRGPGDGRLLPLVLPAGSAPRAAASFRALTRMTAASGDWARQRHALDLFAALAVVCPPRTADAAVLAAAHDPRLGRLLQRIDADPAHPWTVAGLARLAGLSVSHFNAVFRRHCGCGPKRYLVEARLRLALRHLREEADSTIQAAAAAAGFSSQHLFARQFRARFGLTPTAYRASPVLMC
jgi:AraC-like DNA-binding protein